MYTIGYDIGSSSIKATLLDVASGKAVGSAVSPSTEMVIEAPRPGWAEQNPETWWEHVVAATRKVASATGIPPSSVGAVGISYQMHGLVIVDSDNRVVRPSIIWCDSRAVQTGERAFRELGPDTCLRRFLNSPGNFTASKLAWVKEHEPDVFRRVHKMMLPGDYIAMRLSGEPQTTLSGLSEGIMWDYRDRAPATALLDYYGIPGSVIPEIVPTFAVQSRVSGRAAAETGLKTGTSISYRAGDQPNNALSLNVLNPGEVATTAGTSGVIYGVTDTPVHDPASRVNTFIHVNHSRERERYGILQCVNGTGILNSWIKNTIAGPGTGYDAMNGDAGSIAPGADGLRIVPYGNGAERTLGNRDTGASFAGLRFNTHTKAHIYRAAQEGIVFALRYGLEIMHGIGVRAETIRAGETNMFLSPVFRDIFAAVTSASLELYSTDGSQGAARGAALGAGFYADTADAFRGLASNTTVSPDWELHERYEGIYAEWKSHLEKLLT